MAYYALKKDVEAETDLSEALRKGSNGVAKESFLADYHYYRAAVSYLLKKYDQAAQDYAQAIKLNPKYAENPENYYQMGLANTYAQNYEPAIEAYNRAISLGNTNQDYVSDYYYGRGWARMGQKSYEAAIKDFDESLRLKNRPMPTTTEACASYYLYRDAEALEDYSSALATNPKYANALYNRGTIYYNSKRYKEAIADYSKVIEIEGQSTDALNYRGLCYYNLKQYKEAIIEFDKAIAANPAYKLAYTNRALAKHEIGDEKGSEADFKKAKALEEGQSTTTAPNPNDRAENKSNNDLDFDAAGNLKLPKIWALVVGVSEYRNGRINLKYADKDATLFYNFLKSDYGGRVPDEQIVLLTNKEATRANIIKNLKKVSFRAHPDDIFIFYIAGHGQISSTQKGKEVYFLPYDLDSENIDGTALSQGEIQQFVAASQAKKKIWIADACHSGGAGLSTGIIRDPNDNITRFLSEIATSNDSFVILTASRGNEYSFENVQWGGG
ncbi:MAG: tetratricopeptide repeat protein, partial [Saprospiraceae bacterium]|nr:tetratricopeptide repeat protein [Saprospiraceae bacterium]